MPDERSASTDALAQLEQSVAAGHAMLAMATLVSAKGSTPRTAGAKMFVAPDGGVLGSVTIGGCVDARVLEAAERVLSSDSTTRAALLSLSLGDEEAWEIGLTCGGSVEVLVERVDVRDAHDPVLSALASVREATAANEVAVIAGRLDGDRRRAVIVAGRRSGSLGDVALDEALPALADAVVVGGGRVEMVATSRGPERLYLERHAPREQVVVYGAGEIARALVPIVRELGMSLTLVDARERYATRERFPGVEDIRVGMPSEISTTLAFSPRTYVVLVAHDYKFELPVLRHVLATGAGYVGMLGSKKRGAAVKNLLREDGVPDEQLARLHTPIGLDIGARSPAEIALSIAAEIVAVREGKTRG
jgi:xanthine dehydrogenase accessory factor